jgi:hypothetical protein
VGLFEAGIRDILNNPRSSQHAPERVILPAGGIKGRWGLDRRRQIGLLGLTEEVTGDLVEWRLLLLGVVFGLGTLGAVELLARLGR